MRKIERKRMNSEHKKYFLVGSLCIAMFLMLGIGYAVLSQQLDINGTAQITSNWKILFTSAEEKEMNNATTTRKEITDLTTLTLDVNLTQPGASATYDVVVENQGDLDAVLSSIDGVKENNNQDPKAIKVSVENIRVGDPLLAGEDKTFQVKVYWDASVDFSETNMSKEIEITLTYEQSDDGVPVGPIPGDGVDMGGQDVEVVTSGDGLYEDSTRLGRYVYKGANPDNYIQFNDELWRIIAKETDGAYKIARNDLFSGKIQFDKAGQRDNGSNGAGGTYCANSDNGCNAWAANENLVGSPAEFTNTTQTGTVLLDSSLNQYLNGEYLDRISIIEEQMINYNWGVGAIYTAANYEDDNDIDINELVAEENAYQWNGKIALPSASDIYLATSSEELCDSFMKYGNNIETCNYNNYLVNQGLDYALLASLSYSNKVVSYIHNGSIFQFGSATTLNGIRPALYLSSDIKIISGTGTQNDPYVIEVFQ